MILLLLMLTVLPSSEAIGGSRSRSLNELDTLIRSPVEIDEENGTRWAVLVAGSMGYENYRHQADVCHAYQILKKGGLKDENIVVFMFDDIAMNELNPRPGVIINHPQGTNVYAGVPKDYTGEQVTAENLYAVILGDKSSVKGGSGKVVDSKPNDRIFIYISDHGSTGVLNMPNSTMVYANDFINVLKKKHEDRTYKEMVIYLEACDSGSIFEGTLSEDLNIYVTTASGVYESSYATYCPWTHPPAPREYTTCIGDLFSVAWMEDSETNNLKKETIEQQYNKVKERTLNLNSSDDDGSSHVMEYGSKRIKKEMVYLYQGFDPDSKNFLANEAHSNSQMDAIDQRDVDLLFLWQRFKTSTEGSEKKAEILKQIREMMAHRAHLDDSINIIGKLLFEHRKASAILSSTRDQGLPIVDDWDCLKSMVRLFETHCGSLSRHGKKHMRAFANICNNGVTRPAMENACMTACGGKSLEQWIRAYI